MLLQHGWLSPLSKPQTISEEDEEAAENGADMESSGSTEDKEVAAWVISAIERRKAGKLGISDKPALHAAPLDSVSPAPSPAADKFGDGAVAA
jgi:mitogen-activated protein kinase kinase